MYRIILTVTAFTYWFLGTSLILLGIQSYISIINNKLPLYLSSRFNRLMVELKVTDYINISFNSTIIVIATLLLLLGIIFVYFGYGLIKESKKQFDNLHIKEKIERFIKGTLYTMIILQVLLSIGIYIYFIKYGWQSTLPIGTTIVDGQSVFQFVEEFTNSIYFQEGINKEVGVIVEPTTLKQVTIFAGILLGILLGIYGLYLLTFIGLILLILLMYNKLIFGLYHHQDKIKEIAKKAKLKLVQSKRDINL